MRRRVPKDGTLVLPSTISLDTVSPMYKPEGFYRAYDHLIERAGDEPSGYYASLAKSVAISPDRRSIVFRLRPEARWHDGTPITVADVKFSFETFRTDIMASGWKTVLDWIAAVEIVNASEVVVHAKSDVAKQLYIIGYIPIVPAHYWGAKDLTEPTLSLPLQSGPYRVTEISQGRYMIYERVPDYWGRDLPVNRGKFNFDTIRYERYLDATVAREALRAGLFDVWTETDLRHWLTSYDVPARDRGWLVQSTLVSGDVRGSRSRLVLNTRRQPFDDPRVRRALAYALDFEWQNRALHSGELTRAHSYFANSMFASRGSREKRNWACPGMRAAGSSVLSGGALAWVVVAASRARTCSRIVAMTSGFSMRAMTRSLPPHLGQVSMAMAKTRFRRRIQVMGARGLSGFSWRGLRFGTTDSRCLQFGANTPWNRVRFNRGRGTNAARRAMKSSGSRTTWVEPSRNGCLNR